MNSPPGVKEHQPAMASTNEESNIQGKQRNSISGITVFGLGFRNRLERLVSTWCKILLSKVTSRHCLLVLRDVAALCD